MTFPIKPVNPADSTEVSISSILTSLTMSTALAIM